MNMERPTLRLCAVFFLFVAAIHITRFIFQAQAVALGFSEPLWYNLSGCIVPLLFAVWLFKVLLSKPSSKD
jgi:hypothetical protein